MPIELKPLRWMSIRKNVQCGAHWDRAFSTRHIQADLLKFVIAERGDIHDSAILPR